MKLKQKVIDLNNAKENLIQQVKIWHGEAKSQKHTVDEIGKLVGCENDFEMIGAVKNHIKSMEAHMLKKSIRLEKYGKMVDLLDTLIDNIESRLSNLPEHTHSDTERYKQLENWILDLILPDIKTVNEKNDIIKDEIIKEVEETEKRPTGLKEAEETDG